MRRVRNLELNFDQFNELFTPNDEHGVKVYNNESQFLLAYLLATLDCFFYIFMLA